MAELQKEEDPEDQYFSPEEMFDIQKDYIKDTNSIEQSHLPYSNENEKNRQPTDVMSMRMS